MGTNYYWIKKACPTCGHGEELHIGKSSAGWCFALRVYPDRYINTLEDWKREWAKEPAIRDEYGRDVTVKEMLWTITKRSWGETGSIKDPGWLRSNHAIEGPNNLARHAGCPPGEGTWDYCDYEFS